MDNVFVGDYGNNRVQKFQLSSPCASTTKEITPGVCLIRKWGSAGHGDGQFNIPYGIDVDSHGKVLVVDNGNSRIQKINNDGSFITKWGSLGP